MRAQAMTSPVFYKETIWQYTNIRVSCKLLAEPFTQGGMWRLIHICQVGFFVTSEISKMQSNPRLSTTAAWRAHKPAASHLQSHPTGDST